MRTPTYSLKHELLFEDTVTTVECDVYMRTNAIDVNPRALGYGHLREYGHRDELRRLMPVVATRNLLTGIL